MLYINFSAYKMENLSFISIGFRFFLFVSFTHLDVMSEQKMTEIKTFSVDLDKPAKERWSAVARSIGTDLRSIVFDFIDSLCKVLKKCHAMMNFVIELIYRKLSPQQIEEYTPFKVYCQLSLQEFAFLQIFYDFVLMSNNIICSDQRNNTWVAKVVFTRFHYKIKNKLKIMVDFRKNGRSLFKGITYIGLLGIVSGLHSDGTTISVNIYNTRLSKVREEILSLPVNYITNQFHIRLLLEKSPKYLDIVTEARNETFIAEAVISMTGTNMEGLMAFVSGNRFDIMNSMKNAKNHCLVWGNDKQGEKRIQKILKKMPKEDISGETLKALLLQTLTNSTTLVQIIIMSGNSRFILSEFFDNSTIVGEPRNRSGHEFCGLKFLLLLCYLFCINCMEP